MSTESFSIFVCDMYLSRSLSSVSFETFRLLADGRGRWPFGFPRFERLKRVRLLLLLPPKRLPRCCCYLNYDWLDWSFCCLNSHVFENETMIFVLKTRVEKFVFRFMIRNTYVHRLGLVHGDERRDHFVHRIDTNCRFVVDDY